MSILGFKSFILPLITEITSCPSPCGCVFPFAGRSRPVSHSALAHSPRAVPPARAPGQTQSSGCHRTYSEFH